MPKYFDQLNREIEITAFPERIISIVPSQTELLFDLELGDRVIGITKFCIHPTEWFKSKLRIGGTKAVNLDLIRSLQPDLIIANKEENEKDQMLELMNSFPVWISDIKNLDNALDMIIQIGEITQAQNKASKITLEIENNFNALDDIIKNHPNKKNNVAYLIWKDPYISIGEDTFIADMLKKCQLIPVFKDAKRYPEVTLKELKSLKIDYLFLSSEPFPFNERHKLELETELPGIEVILVDGEYFSWYGSRLIKGPCYFQSLLSQLNH